VLNSAGMDAQFERSCCAISRGILNSSFLGWATAADAFAPDVTDATVFDTEITLYAVWGSSN
jgi:mannose/fructose/N-acetylgalactosamine-specific phosphotransferase system component IIC